MKFVPEVLKPSAHYRPVYLVDHLVILGSCNDSANNANSVLTAAAVKCDLSLFVYVLVYRLLECLFAREWKSGSTLWQITVKREKGPCNHVGWQGGRLSRS